MPRRERTVRPQTIVASAKSYGRVKKNDSRVKPGEQWQYAAWDFYDLIPEFGQAAIIQGALLSRAGLVVEEKGADGVWRPTENAVALVALEELFGGEEGHSEMLRQYGINLTTAGEGWLISPPLAEIPAAEADDWQVAAATTLTGGARDGWKVNGKDLPGKRMVLRIWRSHPVDAKKADAPSRRLVGDLSEMLQLKKRVAAQIDSRLSGAGLLLLPNETSFPAMPTRQLNPGDPEPTITDGVKAGDADGLARALMEQAQIAIQDPESAAAMIPLIGMTDGEYIDKIKHITFWSELDKAAPALRQELRETIARGMDIPVEVLLGGQGSNHWNAWLSDENNIKIHAEPALKIVTTGLTTQYLRPGLEGFVDDPKRFRIAADTSKMRLRPNRSKEALELGDRLIMSDEAVLRENGFSPEDMMDKEGLNRALLRKMASGSTTPEIVAIAARMLGVEMPELTDNRAPAEARPTPTLTEHPTRELPERTTTPPAAAIGLVFAAEQMVDRALQRAGNRAKTKYGIRQPDRPANRLYLSIPLVAADCDDLLADAWECTREFDLGVDPAKLARALDIYARSVMIGRKEPSRASLQRALTMLMSETAA